MRVTLLAIGRARTGPEQDLIADYARRFEGLGSGLGFGKFEIREMEIKKRVEGEERKRLEGELLLAAIPAGAYVIVLDERGDTLTSPDFADLLAEKRDSSLSDLVLIIGGAEGLTKEVRGRGDKRVSFSPMTWPHMLVRVMITEQLYRAASILAGHPYHKA